MHIERSLLSLILLFPWQWLCHYLLLNKTKAQFYCVEFQVVRPSLTTNERVGDRGRGIVTSGMLLYHFQEKHVSYVTQFKFYHSFLDIPSYSTPLPGCSHKQHSNCQCCCSPDTSWEQQTAKWAPSGRPPAITGGQAALVGSHDLSVEDANGQQFS